MKLTRQVFASFLSGLGSPAELYTVPSAKEIILKALEKRLGKIEVYASSEEPDHEALQAMRSDWMHIGDDLRRVMAREITNHEYAQTAQPTQANPTDKDCYAAG